MHLFGVDLGREDTAPLAVLLAGVVAVFGRALVAPSRLLVSPDSDTVFQYYPWRVHLERALSEGGLPLWNPYNFGGEPFVANSQVGTFFPPDRLLFALLPGPYAVTVAMAGSVLCAGVGTYLLCLRFDRSRTGALVAALSFALSMAVLARVYVGHYTIVVAVGLLPVAYLTTDRALETGRLGHAVLAGCVLALSVLAGQVQYPYLTVVGLGGYALFRVASFVDEPHARVVRLVRTFAPMGVVAGLLSAVQVLPTLYFSEHSTRAAGLTLAESAIYPLPPYQLAQFLTPYALGRPRGPLLELGNFWEWAFHPGVAPLLLASLAVARWRDERVAALLATGVASLALAVGGPIYAAFFRLVPLAGSFRVPGRFTLFTAFAVAVLAAFGYDRLVAGRVTRREWLLPGAVVAGAVGLFAVVVGFEGLVRGTVVGGVSGLYPFVVRELGVAAAVAVGSLAALVAVDRRATLGTWVAAASDRSVDVGPVLRVAVVLVTLVPLAAYGAPLVVSEPVDAVYDEPAFDRDERVFDARAALTPNAYRSPALAEPENLRGGPRSLGGYNSLQTATSRALLERLSAGDAAANEPVLDAWAVTVVLSADGHDAPDYERAGTVDGAVASRNGDARAPVYHVPGVEGESGVRVATETRLSTARDLEAERSPGRVVATGEFEAGVVVLARTHYPLWTARVDGEPVEPVATETGLLAVPVADGAKRVTVAYRSWPLRVGAALSGLGLLVVAGVALWELWWRERV